MYFVHAGARSAIGGGWTGLTSPARAFISWLCKLRQAQTESSPRGHAAPRGATSTAASSGLSSKAKGASARAKATRRKTDRKAGSSGPSAQVLPAELAEEVTSLGSSAAASEGEDSSTRPSSSQAFVSPGLVRDHLGSAVAIQQPSADSIISGQRPGIRACSRLRGGLGQEQSTASMRSRRCSCCVWHRGQQIGERPVMPRGIRPAK